MSRRSNDLQRKSGLYGCEVHDRFYYVNSSHTRVMIEVLFRTHFVYANDNPYDKLTQTTS